MTKRKPKKGKRPSQEIADIVNEICIDKGGICHYCQTKAICEWLDKHYEK